MLKLRLIVYRRITSDDAASDPHKILVFRVKTALIIEGEDESTLIMQHLPPHFFFFFNQAIGIFNGFCVERAERRARETLMQ